MTVSFSGFAAPCRLAPALLAAVVLASAPAAFAETRTAKARHKASAKSAATATATAAPATATVKSSSLKSRSRSAAVSKRTVKSEPVEPAFALPVPSPEQVDAAGRVYYGVYDCEFKQTIDIAASAAHPSYVDLRLARAGYLMKPVLSSTGAIRLEDVKGEMLMVQIASKSMLLNVKTAQRIVDDCVNEKQRQLTEAARAAKAAQAARAAASPASPPGTAVTLESPPSGLLIAPASPAAPATLATPAAAPAAPPAIASAPEAAPGATVAPDADAAVPPAVPQGAPSSPQP